MIEKLQINSNLVILMEYENKVQSFCHSIFSSMSIKEKICRVQNEKYYEDFRIQKYGKELKCFSRDFHLASTIYF